METIQENPNDPAPKPLVSCLKVPSFCVEPYRSLSAANDIEPIYSFSNINGDDVEVEIDLEKLSPPLPPDGGWGWFIVFGSFLCMVLVDGMCFSYGIFLSELEETFGASKMQMTLGGSLLTGFYFMVGPPVSALLNKFGSREIVLIGTVISTFWRFWRHWLWMHLFTAATIVTSWFVRKRATVTGIVMAGSGIGGVLYSLIVPSLIQSYTWRGCILLLAGVNFHCAVAGALFRPLRPTDYKYNCEDKNENDTKNIASYTPYSSKAEPLLMKNANESTNEVHNPMRQNRDFSATSEINSSGLNITSNRDHKQSIVRLPSDGKLTQTSRVKRTNTIDDDAVITHSNQFVSGVKNTSNMQNNPSECIPVMSVEAVNRIVGDVLNRQVIASSTSLATPEFSSKLRLSSIVSQKNLHTSQVYTEPTESAVVYRKPDNFGSTTHFASAVSLKMPADSSMCQAIVNELQKEISRPAYKKDLFLSGSLIHLNEFLSTTDVASYIRSVTIPAEEMNIDRPVWSMFKNVLGLELLKSLTFVLLAISSVLSMIGYCVPYQFLKDNAQHLGASEASASYLLAYLGGLNTVGRILTGWASDRSWANVLYINNISLVVSGLLTALVPLFRAYEALVAYACVYGFFISAFISVRTILIVQVLGLDRLTNAFGFMLLFQAFAFIGAPPAFGALYDQNKNFDLIFILGGLSVILSGVLCFPLVIVANWENRRAGRAIEKEVNSDEENDHGLYPVRLLRRIRDWFNKKHQSSKKTNIVY
ncbi:unnamed protein product [Heterobilharzia americana]|nr:unnamed protein product [Heterobilharzia americana]